MTPRNRNSTLYTKQYRLFRKGSLEWKGLLHETPRILGKVKDIRIEELYVIHDTGKPKRWDYNKLNDVFPVERPIKMAIRDAYVQRSFNNLNPIDTLKFTGKKHSEYKDRYSRLPEKNKRIINYLRRYGIIKYLGFDTKEGTEKKIKEYSKSKSQGIELLIKMLNERAAE